MLDSAFDAAAAPPTQGDSSRLGMLDSPFDSHILCSLRVTVLASKAKYNNRPHIRGGDCCIWLRMLDSNQRPAD